MISKGRILIVNADNTFRIEHVDTATAVVAVSMLDRMLMMLT